jgi:hypothetical protein
MGEQSAHLRRVDVSRGDKNCHIVCNRVAAFITKRRFSSFHKVPRNQFNHAYDSHEARPPTVFDRKQAGRLFNKEGVKR